MPHSHSFRVSHREGVKPVFKEQAQTAQSSVFGGGKVPGVLSLSPCKLCLRPPDMEGQHRIRVSPWA